jgi:hypothetical protein
VSEVLLYAFAFGLHVSLTLLLIDHIIYRQCPFISQEIKDEYVRLKQSKGLTRGKKAYWIEAAEERGLCNSEEGITFNKKFKDK